MAEASKQTAWMSDVAARPASMTQRKQSTVDSWPGGIEELVREAQAHGVHLLRVTDDKGNVLIAASTHAFEVLR